jgi:sulfur carrier protein ThiS
MKIDVSLHLNLKDYSPDGKRDFEMEVESNATIASLITSLALPPQVERVILVNGRHANPETSLVENDRVTMFPPMSGG